MDKAFGYFVLFAGAFFWILDMMYNAYLERYQMKSALICSGVVAAVALCVGIIIHTLP